MNYAYPGKSLTFKGPFTQAIFVAATRCNFCHAKIASSFKYVRNPSDIAATNRSKNRTWFTRAILSCNLSATKIVSSCCDKNRLCKRALIVPWFSRHCQPWLTMVDCDTTVVSDHGPSELLIMVYCQPWSENVGEY